MKVALELQPCCGNRSGIGTYTYELAKRLRDENGLEFVGNLFNFMGRNDNSAHLNGISMPIRESHLFPYGIYRRVWNRIPIPYNGLFPGKADLNLFFNYIVPPRVSGMVATTVYDMTYLRFPETMDVRNRKRLQAGMEYSVRRSNHIITISEFSKREIVELMAVPEEKISVVPCAPSSMWGQTSLDELSRKFHICPPYLLYVGTIEPRKNLTRLLLAYQQLRSKYRIPHQLVLAGGSGWCNDGIYHTAQSLPDRDQIIFTGYVSGEEKNGLYANADAFLFPSLYEGFGIPPLEAMHFGCPVVCADAASLPEVAGGAANLVDPTDVDSISQGIWKVLSDKDYAARLSALGLDQVKKFTWEASAQKLAEICHRVLEEP